MDNIFKVLKNINFDDNDSIYFQNIYIKHINNIERYINSYDILFISIIIYKKYDNILKLKKYVLLWIIYIINLKYYIDYDISIIRYIMSINYNLDDFTNIEIDILTNINWQLEISQHDFNEIKYIFECTCPNLCICNKNITRILYN